MTQLQDNNVSIWGILCDRFFRVTYSCVLTCHLASSSLWFLAWTNSRWTALLSSKTFWLPALGASKHILLDLTFDLAAACQVSLPDGPLCVLSNYSCTSSLVVSDCTVRKAQVSKFTLSQQKIVWLFALCFKNSKGFCSTCGHYSFPLVFSLGQFPMFL